MTNRLNGNVFMFILTKCGVNVIGLDVSDTFVYCNFCNEEIIIAPIY